MLSTSQLPGLELKWLLVITAAWIVYKVIYAKFFSSTKHVPGDLLDKISGVRFLISTITGNKMYFALEQHRKYGPLVEIAPNKLACNDNNATKTVYGSHDWVKSNFYSDFADFNGTSSLFSETHKVRAQALRRCFLPAFARSNILVMSENIFAHLRKFLVKLEEFDREGKPMDAYVWTRYLTFEVVTDVGFGADYDMISTGELNHAFVRDFDDSVTFGIIQSLSPFLSYLPTVLWPTARLRELKTAEGRTVKHGQEGLRRWRESRNTGEARVDILQRLIEYGEAHPEDKLSENELITEIMEIMLAGGDTTASTVTYGCYELARNPEIQHDLIAALKAGIPDPDNVTLQQLESIPYLDWTIKEMLRMHPTIPSLLERVVPSSGAVVAGMPLAGGTIVAMSAFVMHQNKAVFPTPEQFQPDRWSQKSTIMESNMLAFSTGPRSCVGQNLAITQMKIHMGLIFRNYYVNLHPETTAASMHAKDFFQGKPQAGRCMLYFKKL